MQPIFFKIINDDLISIREINDYDINDLYELFSKESVCQFLGLNPIQDINLVKEKINRIREEYKQGSIYYLGIILKENDKLIGYIGLSRYDLSEKTCQVVYALNDNYWYKGIMVRALKLFVNYLLEVQQKELIIGTHIVENERSGKVMEKAGFKRDKNYDRIMNIKGIDQNLIGYTIKKEETL